MDTDSADLALTRRVTAGEEQALTDFYNRYADPLFAFIYHRLSTSRDDAEEVWQDTLLAAVHALPAYRGQSRLFTWLCGIARHKIGDHCRRTRRVLDPVETGQSLDELGERMAVGPLPEEILARMDTRLRVVETLAALPDEYRTVLTARYGDGCSVSEVATLLGRTYKATESLLSRAKAAFRAELTARTKREGRDG